ncbi:hypothetical protein SAMN04488557_1940 [Hyphomicrobium facile]|uniref:Uncharacterized protein n=1 Tax=Hyphomicrobium facile TaxID=51670 RepID=A0A1I7NFD5_9HYPH|nr:hypothetical protein SAMN04488557_1940 [Hyphomicrobium facile]
MPPEVLALSWALLFVVASGLVFRFYFWLGRRSRDRQSSSITPNRAEDAVAPKAAAPVPVTAPPPAPRAVDVPRTASRPAVAANVPKPAPARAYASPRSSIEPIAPNVERSVGIADKPVAEALEPPKPSIRAALKPSIGATLAPTPPPTVLQKPSTAATLPPAQAEPTAQIAEVIAERVAEPAAPAIATASDPAPDLPAPAAPFVARTTLFNSKLLRAWKLGAIAQRLDVRLKESRNRKVVSGPKTSRKPPEAVSTKELKVLAQRTAPDRAPVRRIRRKAGAENILASAQAQTRIVGVPPRGYRVLAANEL